MHGFTRKMFDESCKVMASGAITLRGPSWGHPTTSPDCPVMTTRNSLLSMQSKPGPRDNRLASGIVVAEPPCDIGRDSVMIVP